MDIPRTLLVTWSFAAALAVMGGAVAASATSGVGVFGPKDYVRSTGKPVLVTDTFTAGRSGWQPSSTKR